MSSTYSKSDDVDILAEKPTAENKESVRNKKLKPKQHFHKKVGDYVKKNSVELFVGALKFISVQILFFGIGWIIYSIWNLKQNYATLEERSKNAQSSLISEINCKNNILVDCYGKCTFRQVVEKQHACEPTK